MGHEQLSDEAGFAAGLQPASLPHRSAAHADANRARRMASPSNQQYACYPERDRIMANTPYDPSAYKAQQRAQWSNAAQGWRRWWATIEQGAQPVSDRMMELAHIAPGQRVLDVATGIGEPALTAARRVGPGGAVVALDQAPEMLAVARDRLRAANVTTVELVEGDAETTALAPDAFNAITCRWGLMFFSDPASTLARLRASLIPNGWIALAVWGPPQRVPVIALSFAVLTYGMEQSAPPPSGPNFFAFAEPDALERVVRDAGFVEVHTEPTTVTYTFAAMSDLVAYIEDVSAPVGAFLASQPPERQAEFRAKLASAAGAYVGADGMIRLPNDCLLVAGRR
jgi:SAM-dependent methyltransferase